MHVQFIVEGPPVSNQASGPNGTANLVAWKTKVRGQAAAAWSAQPKLKGKLKALIINFHTGDKPPVDVDNMSKPILDSLNDLVYDDDRQIRQAEIIHIRIDAPMVIAGASKVLVDAVQLGKQFVYIRIADPIDPYPLPK